MIDNKRAEPTEVVSDSGFRKQGYKNPSHSGRAAVFYAVLVQTMSSELQQWYSAQLQQTTDSFDMFLQAVLAPEVVADTASSGDNTTPPGTEEGSFSALHPNASVLDTTLAIGSAT